VRQVSYVTKSSPASYRSASIDMAASALRALAQVTRSAEQRRARDLGVSPAQLLILGSLSARPGQCINDLAQFTHTHQTSVSPLVQALAEAGLVSRRQSASDVREAEVRLTPKGRRIVERARKGTGWPLKDSLQQLKADDRSELIRILSVLVAAVTSKEAATRGANPQGEKVRRRAMAQGGV